MNVDGAWVMGMEGKSILVAGIHEACSRSTTRCSGPHSGDVAARLAALDSEGSRPGAGLPERRIRLASAGPDREVREEACFRIYNEYIASIQERSGQRLHSYGVGLINWWDAEGTPGAR